ncbi:MAG: DinB family protein [Chloroflexi bacterium]|nr:DinB family protein [Chloroflexota bacterium]
MISQQLLKNLYEESYALVKQQIEGITHQESIYQPSYGGNCINWILGHIIVARCNFMMMLDIPSIWDMAQCRRFIPGSAPITGVNDAILFETLCVDLDNTQEQLLMALDQVPREKLQEISGKKTIGKHIAFYNSHEAYHAGQLEVLCQMLNKREA